MELHTASTGPVPVLVLVLVFPLGSSRVIVDEGSFLFPHITSKSKTLNLSVVSSSL